MDELVELQTAISMIKVEHEEHRTNVMKLANMKKKLQEEINKNQKILQRYQKIKEKLKIEQSILRNRQDSLSRKTPVDNVDQPNDAEKLSDDTKIFNI